MEVDPNQLNYLIKNRRSINPRQFISGKIIPQETVEQILENARWAPTHSMTEPWFFTVFHGEGIKKLAQFQASLYKEKAGSLFDDFKYKKLKETPLCASHIIAIGMKRSSTTIPEIEEVEAVACAAQNMMLTATAYGVTAFWGSGGITYYEEAKSFFGLDKQDKLLGYLYLGYSSILPPQARRKPIQEKSQWIKE